MTASAAKQPAACEGANFSACVVGAGAIGCHIAWCLRRAGATVYMLARGDAHRALSTEGLKITVVGETYVDRGIHVVTAEDLLAGKGPGPVDYCIFAVKMYSLAAVVDSVQPLIGPDTAILPPTTALPYWWFYGVLGELAGTQLPSLDPGGRLWCVLPPSQCLGMTYWLSGVREAPGVVNIKHVQRGYPIGVLGTGENFVSEARAKRLAEALEQGGGVPAPVVDNIRAEIFIKAVNSMAFNAVAVLTGATNGQLADSQPSVATVIHDVMTELERVQPELPLQQTAQERIDQTLASRAHTMSMLHDFNEGKELEAGPVFASFEAVAALTGATLSLTSSLVRLLLLRKEVAGMAARQ